MPPRPDLAKVKFGKPVTLFNGKDLTGWKLRRPEKLNGWFVKDGLLVNETHRTDFSATVLMEICAPKRFSKISNYISNFSSRRVVTAASIFVVCMRPRSWTAIAACRVFREWRGFWSGGSIEECGLRGRKVAEL